MGVGTRGRQICTVGSTKGKALGPAGYFGQVKYPDLQQIETAGVYPKFLQ